MVSEDVNNNGAALRYALTNMRVVPSAGIGVRDKTRAGWSRDGCRSKIWDSFMPYVANRRVSRILEEVQGPRLLLSTTTIPWKGEKDHLLGRHASQTHFYRYRQVLKG